MTEDAGAHGGRGSGPGEFTADGNAVELYARLPPGDEPDVVCAAVPPPASLLELGAGAGRVTHALVARGHRVVAVDASREMLARVRGARTVHSAIEDLRLAERFDAVLLPSFLVNTAEPASVREMLRCCRHHVARGGKVLVQRQGADWFAGRRVAGAWTRGGVRTWIASVEAAGPDAADVRIEYEIGTDRWSHAFRARDVPDTELERLLRGAGLERVRYLTEDRSWVEAAPR